MRITNHKWWWWQPGDIDRYNSNSNTIDTRYSTRDRKKNKFDESTFWETIFLLHFYVLNLSVYMWGLTFYSHVENTSMAALFHCQGEVCHYEGEVWARKPSLIPPRVIVSVPGQDSFCIVILWQKQSGEQNETIFLKQYVTLLLNEVRYMHQLSHTRGPAFRTKAYLSIRLILVF